LIEAYLGVTSEPKRIGGIELDICSGARARFDAVVGLQRRIDESCDLLCGVTVANGNPTFCRANVSLRISGGNCQKQRYS
jgi:hypothetical protein